MKSMSMMMIMAIPLLGGCGVFGGANEQKYELAQSRVWAAAEMYKDKQLTDRIKALSRASVAKAGMGIVSVPTVQEKPDIKVSEPELLNCQKLEDNFLEKCDTESAKNEELESVCNSWRKQVEREQDRCEAQQVTGLEEEPIQEASEQTEEYATQGSFLSEAMEQARAENAGTVVINQIIGDGNTTTGQRNNHNTGPGTQTINAGQVPGVSVDPETAAILKLAGVDPDSDLEEGGEIFKNAAGTAAKIAPWAAGAFVAGAVTDGFEAGFEEAGPVVVNSMNPDNSTRPIVFAPESETEE